MTQITDYADVLLRIENILEKVHNDLRDKRYEAASEKALGLVAETRFLFNTIVIMKEHSNALRQQTQTVQERVPTTNQTRGNPRQTGASTSKAGVGQKRH